MNKDQFYADLNELEIRFENTEPELVETQKDPETGVEGYVVVWNTGISVGGPLERMGKGGTRITPNVTLDEIKMLSRIMALKNAAAGLAVGGAKSGLRADPDAPDFEQTYRKWVSSCKPILHENGGIFGGFGFDIGARPIHPKWACDELGSTKSFTGKPVDMGGTDYDKEGVAGLGVAVAAKVALDYDGKSADGATFSVQGIGAMGAAVIKYFSEYGAVLKSVSDPRLDGTWVFPDGASEELIRSLGSGDIEKTKALLNDGAGEHLSGDSLDALYADVDVIFPSAVQDVITIDNQDKIKAAYMSEGANNPTSEEARTALHDRGVTVIPDFIANPGGVIAAFIELSLDVSPEENAKTRKKVIEAKNYTITKITENVNRLMELVRDLGVEPAHAGKYMALTNIFKAD